MKEWKLAWASWLRKEGDVAVKWKGDNGAWVLFSGKKKKEKERKRR